MPLPFTESAAPEVRETLQQFLHDAIDTHEQIYNYMDEKGFYQSHDITRQIGLDMQAAETAKDLPQM
ncbi:spore coat protein [Bacillus nakamurai]|uniref:spore coat protein n=1 Tax=Bacillus nakamurai TaxID=1793963 RepID=UPI00398F7369